MTQRLLIPHAGLELPHIVPSTDDEEPGDPVKAGYPGARASMGMMALWTSQDKLKDANSFYLRPDTQAYFAWDLQLGDLPRFATSNMNFLNCANPTYVNKNTGIGDFYDPGKLDENYVTSDDRTLSPYTQALYNAEQNFDEGIVGVYGDNPAGVPFDPAQHGKYNLRNGWFRRYPTVTACVSLSMVKAPACTSWAQYDAYSFAQTTIAYRQGEWVKICDGTYDHIVVEIARKIRAMVAAGCARPIIRLAHENELFGYYWGKIGIDEDVWRAGWQRWATILRGDGTDSALDTPECGGAPLGGVTNPYGLTPVTRLPDSLSLPLCYLDYQGNGAWVKLTWKQALQNHNVLMSRKSNPALWQVPVPGVDDRLTWEVAKPEPEFYDIFGCDLYAGAGDWTADAFFQRLQAVKDIATAEGKPFSVPEWGVYNGLLLPDGMRVNGESYFQDDPQAASMAPRSTKKFIERMWAFIADTPATGPGSCRYWSYFFWIKPSGMASNWPKTWVRFKEIYKSAV